MANRHSSIQYLQENAIIIVLGLFFVLGLCYSSVTPLWSPPDEDRHFAYCEYIALNKSLPNLNAQDKAFHISQAVHPPLYYAIGSLFYKNDSEPLFKQLSIHEGPGYILVQPKAEPASSYASKARTAYMLRFLSLFFSGLTIYLAYKIILSLFPGESVMAATGALILATNPQFLHVSASISNEPLSTAFTALYLFMLINFFKPPGKSYAHAGAGLVLGCCLLTKVSTIIYIPITVVALILAYRRETKKIFRGLFIILSLALLVSGWWYIRNWILFHDPVFSKAIEAIQPWAIRGKPFSISYGAFIVKMTFTSFFGYFGSMQIPLMQTHLMVYALLLAASAAGFCKMRATLTTGSRQTRILMLLLVSIGCCILLFINFNIRYSMFMGRYLFVVLVPIAVVMVTGLSLLVSGKKKNAFLLLVAFLLIAVNLDVFFRVLRPAYAETALKEDTEQQAFCCPTPEIKQGSLIGQTFIASHDNLCAVRVMFSNESTPQSGDILFRLKQVNDTVDAVQIKIPVREIDDFSKYFFVFPPLHSSKGKRYAFSFEACSQDQDKGVSLWYAKDSSCDNCSLLVNGSQSKGALYFSTYHFTGDRPKTDWQGRKPVAINQGWYV
ncbi:MAG: glycosyltransferase family 39 protein, partial [Pseudomonadota bacterium]